MRIDHVAIAVEDLDRAIQVYSNLLGAECAPVVEDVASEGVRVAIFQLGESSIELVAPTTSDSSIAKFIEKRGGGLHHIALRVDGIDSKCSELKQQGLRLIGDVRSGSRKSRICFVHPKSAEGVLVELVEFDR